MTAGKSILVILIILSIVCIAYIFFADFFKSKRLREKQGLEKFNSNIEKADIYSINYDKYDMTLKEKASYYSIASVIIFSAAFIFYHSFVFALLLTPFSYFYIKLKRKELIAKRKIELNLQFMDALYSISSSLMAGKSIETAIEASLKDLIIQYKDEEALIIREMNSIVHKLSLNETLEAAFGDFAKRAKIEDIENFAEVLITCKRTGGDLIQVIRSTTEIINDKLHIKQEIDNLTAKRRFEQKILNIMPVGLLAVVSLSAGDFIKPIYTTIQGRIAVTVSIILFTAAYFISAKIMDIEV